MNWICNQLPLQCFITFKIIAGASGRRNIRWNILFPPPHLFGGTSITDPWHWNCKVIVLEIPFCFVIGMNISNAISELVHKLLKFSSHYWVYNRNTCTKKFWRKLNYLILYTVNKVFSKGYSDCHKHGPHDNSPQNLLIILQKYVPIYYKTSNVKY